MTQPLGVYIGKLIKYYYSMLSEELKDLSIERYFYPLITIKNHACSSSQKILAEELGVDKVTMVRILDYLEEHQCISRNPNPKDRRVKRIELTEKGEKYTVRIEQAISRVDELLLAEVDKEEKKQLFHQLAKILEQAKDIPLEKVELTLKNKAWQ